MAIWIFVCLLLYTTKLASRLIFRWWIGGRILYIKCACKNLIAKCLQLLDMHCLTGSDMISYLKGKWNVSALNTFLKGVFPGHKQCIWWHCWCNSCWSHGSCAVFCLWVNWHPQPRIVPNYKCVKGENQLGWWLCHQQVRICWCISCKPLYCNPHGSSNTAKAASTGSVFILSSPYVMHDGM